MAYSKLIRSGNLVEVWRYEREPSPKRLENRKPRRKRIFQQERRLDSIRACRKAFFRLVRSNLDTQKPPALLTLTMRDVVSIADAYKAFTRFGTRFRRKYGTEVSWIAVPEFQKRGAVHFHVLVFNFEYGSYSSERSNRKIAKLWGHGFVDIMRTDGSPKLAAYLAKYMSKAMHDNRLVGKRAYSASRNVMRPMLLNTPFQLSYAFKDWGLGGVDNSPVAEKQYDTMHLGRCIYKSYLL